MYEQLIKNHKPEFEKSITHLQAELSSIRTGRANPALVEGLLVECYGAKTPLKNLASITVPEARSLLIQPWDKSILRDVEKAFETSNLGVQPTNDGNNIRVTLPQLSEERRQEMVRLVRQHAEAARVTARGAREEIWKEVIRLEREGALTEDQKYAAQNRLKEVVEEYNTKIKTIADKKEEEVMTV